ncbi:MAG: bifunctional precorrin-2 dehydrogenase/sirohydrochlorin ferrochelatase [Blastocatellia bacterium]
MIIEANDGHSRRELRAGNAAGMRTLMKYYPISLDLRGRAALVVGGGEAAEEHAKQLLAAGARVMVVNPGLNDGLGDMTAFRLVEFQCRAFEARDLTGISLVICATDDQTVTETVARAAAAHGVLCHVVDQRELCSFQTPAVIARGDLLITVTCQGAGSPLAQRVRREIDELIGPEYENLQTLSVQLLAEAQQRLPYASTRCQVLRNFIESEALELLRQGRAEEAMKLAQSMLAAAEPRAVALKFA